VSVCNLGKTWQLNKIVLLESGFEFNLQQGALNFMKTVPIRLNRIQNKIGLGFLVVVIFFVIAILSVTRQLSSFQKETRFITDHDMQVNSLAQSIEKDLVDMETGQRGFIITGENKYFWNLITMVKPTGKSTMTLFSNLLPIIRANRTT
jgi:hypothetical protein